MFPLLIITTVLLTLSFYFRKTETVSLAEGSRQQRNWSSQAPTLSVCAPGGHFRGTHPARIINTYKNCEAGEDRSQSLTLPMMSFMHRKENGKGRSQTSMFCVLFLPYCGPCSKDLQFPVKHGSIHTISLSSVVNCDRVFSRAT